MDYISVDIRVVAFIMFVSLVLSIPRMYIVLD